jgi:SAM-dependent methyltransferase
MFSRTLKKKLRLAALRHVLGRLGAQSCLLVTCGDNNGAINVHLRRLGGRWSWADCETTSIREMAQLLGDHVAHVDPGHLPYPEGCFDWVVTIDVHEHLDAPEAFMAEVWRVLAPGGRAIVTVPGGDRRKLVNRLKEALGMTRAKYGHVRDGFSVAELGALMQAEGLRPGRHVTFSRLFTELIELAINVVYVKKLARASEVPVAEGTIAPATLDQLRAVRKTYRLYSLVYPFVWLGSQLDRLLFFTEGYVVLVEGSKDLAAEKRSLS